MRKKIDVFIAVSFAALAAMAVPSFAMGSDPFLTSYTLLLGYPENGDGGQGTTTILPGTVVPALDGEQWSQSIHKMKRQIKQAYRLDKLVTSTVYRKRLFGSERASMPAPDGWQVNLTLVGANETLATYRVEIVVEGATVADTPVSVKRSGKAVVGSRVQDAKHDDPYVFIILGVTESDPTPAENGGIFQPIVIEAINPVYPDSCKKAGLEGVVLVKSLVGKDGSCRVKEILKSPDARFSRAATEAVNQWRFEPARTIQGEPVDLEYTLTIAFRLEDDKK